MRGINVEAVAAARLKRATGRFVKSAVDVWDGLVGGGA